LQKKSKAQKLKHLKASMFAKHKIKVSLSMFCGNLGISNLGDINHYKKSRTAAVV